MQAQNLSQGEWLLPSSCGRNALCIPQCAWAKALGDASALVLLKVLICIAYWLAGIMGAKQTSQLIPLCHNILLTKVKVWLELDQEAPIVQIHGEAHTIGQTGGAAMLGCTNDILQIKIISS